VGVILWELLARRRMWANKGEAEIIRELLSDNVPSLSAVAPDLDPQLRRICAKALAPQAEDRYESAAALLADLQRYLALQGGPVPDAAIAEVIGKLCGDMRQSAQQRLEQELAKFSSHGEETWDDPTSLPPPPVARTEESRSGARALPAGGKAQKAEGENARIADAAEAETLTHERRPTPPRSNLWWLSAAVLLGGGGWVAATQGWTRASTLAAPPVAAAPLDAPAASSPAVVTHEPKPAEVSINVSAKPAHAHVYLDDQPVTNPYRAARAQDAVVHVVRVEADGHVPVLREVRFDADIDLQFSLSAAPVAQLEPPPPAEPAARTTARRKPGGLKGATKPVSAVVEKPAEKPAAEKPAAAPDCDPPHYFDDQGIKRYRRECLGR